jgi:hypothetical protein
MQPHAAVSRAGLTAAQAALLATPASFALDVGQALGYTLLVSIYVFIYVLILMAPFLVLYQILRIPMKLAGRCPVRRGP